MTNPRKLLAIAITAVILAVVIFLILHQTRALARGPEVAIQYPRDKSAVEEAFVILEGSSKHVANMSINGNTVIPDSSGRFTYPLTLAPGENRIVLQAEDRFEQQSILELTLFGQFEKDHLSDLVTQPVTGPFPETGTQNEASENTDAQADTSL